MLRFRCISSFLRLGMFLRWRGGVGLVMGGGDDGVRIIIDKVEKIVTGKRLKTCQTRTRLIVNIS